MLLLITTYSFYDFVVFNHTTVEKKHHSFITNLFSLQLFQEQIWIIDQMITHLLTNKIRVTFISEIIQIIYQKLDKPLVTIHVK